MMSLKDIKQLAGIIFFLIVLCLVALIGRAEVLHII